MRRRYEERGVPHERRSRQRLQVPVMRYTNNVDNLSRTDLLLILQFSNISAPEAADSAARLATLMHLLTAEQCGVFLGVLGRPLPLRSVCAVDSRSDLRGRFPLQFIRPALADPAYSGSFAMRAVGRYEADQITDTQILNIIVAILQECILKGEIDGIRSNEVTADTRLLSGLRLDFEEAAAYCGNIVDVLSTRIVTTCAGFGDMEDISLDCCARDATLSEYAQRLHSELQSSSPPTVISQSSEQAGNGPETERQTAETVASG